MLELILLTVEEVKKWLIEELEKCPTSPAKAAPSQGLGITMASGARSVPTPASLAVSRPGDLVMGSNDRGHP